MARIAGVDIPREKRLEISLTYIFGVGRTTAQQICDGSGISRDTRVRDLTRFSTWTDIVAIVSFLAPLAGEPSPSQPVGMLLALAVTLVTMIAPTARARPSSATARRAAARGRSPGAGSRSCPRRSR